MKIFATLKLTVKITDLLEKNVPEFPPVCQDYVDEVSSSAEKYGIDPLLLFAIMKQESNCNPPADSGSSVGLMQINRIQEIKQHRSI